MNAISIEISIAVIAGFAADGRVFRAFGHLLGERPGELLLVPLGRTTGDLRQVTDGCPVPWNEVTAVIDTPPAAMASVPPEDMCKAHPRLAMITPYGWAADRIALAPGVAPNIERLTHVSGMSFARVAP